MFQRHCRQLAVFFGFVISAEFSVFELETEVLTDEVSGVDISTEFSNVELSDEVVTRLLSSELWIQQNQSAVDLTYEVAAIVWSGIVPSPALIDGELTTEVDTGLLVWWCGILQDLIDDELGN